MDDTASKENPSKDFNKLDLSQLQGFSFGTQWTQDKGAARGQHREDRGRRDDGGAHRESGEARRDRRNFRKHADTGRPQPPPHAAAGEGGGQQRHRPERAPRRDFHPGAAAGPRGRGQGAPGDPRRDFRGDQRRETQGGERAHGQGERGGFFRGGFHGRHDAQPEQRGAYISPYFNVIFYPEDGGFSALAKAIRSSCRTYELFEIARVIVGKTDRFVAALQRKPPGGQHPGQPPQPRKKTPAAGTGNAAPATAPETGAPPPAPAKPPPLALSLPDGLPFENEDAAISHVLAHHLDKFFDRAEVEVEPPKGNFLVINKCGVTGELLGPPNYHRYNQIVQQHHAARVARMPFEMFRGRIETIRDPEVVNQWLEKMKKTTRYAWKLTPPAEGAGPLCFDSFDDARAYLLANARDKVVKSVETARLHGKLLDTLPQGEIRRAIEGALERQRRFPLDTANALRGRLRREGFTIFKKGSKGISYVCAVKRKFRVPGQAFSDSIGALIAFIEAHPMIKASELPVKFLGIHPPAPPPQPAATAPEPAPEPEPEQPAPAAKTGSAAEAAPPSAETAPSSTETAPAEAEAVPAETGAAAETAPPAAEAAPAAETADAETADAETAAGETASTANEPQAPAQTDEAAAPRPAGDEPQSTAAAAEPSTPPSAAAAADADASAALPRPSGSVVPFTGHTAATALSAEDKTRLHTLTGDLHWLVSEGYVTEFIDGRLFASPPMTEARKQEVEKEEHDPENFPDAPAPDPEDAPASEPAAPDAGEAAPAPAEPDTPDADATAPEEPAPEEPAPEEPAPEEPTSEAEEPASGEPAPAPEEPMPEPAAPAAETAPAAEAESAPEASPAAETFPAPEVPPAAEPAPEEPPKTE